MRTPSPRLHSLTRHCCVPLIVIGLLLSAGSFGVHLLYRHQHVVKEQTQRVKDTAHIRLPKLATALWNINTTEVGQELDGLAALSGVAWVELQTPMGPSKSSKRTPRTAQATGELIKLDVTLPNHPASLGTLMIQLDNLPLWGSYQYDAVLTGAAQLLQLLVVVGFGSYFLRKRVLNRIRQQTHQLRELDPEKPELPTAGSPPDPQDEIDQLTEAIADTRHQLALALHASRQRESQARDELMRLEGEIVRRTGEALYLSGFLQQLSRMSSDMLVLHCDKIDGALHDALHEMGVFLGLDTCFVIFMGDDDQAEIRGFWRKETLSVAPLEVFLSRHRDEYIYSFTKLSQEKLTQLDPKTLPADSIERQLCHLLALQSLTLIRLDSPEGNIGLLCVGMSDVQHTLSEMECRLLVITGNIVANLLQHRQEQNRTKQLDDELYTTQQQLAGLIQNDKLTGLNNAQAFRNTLEHEIRRAQRTGSPIALILLEIDRFSVFRAQHGETVTNEALRNIAQALNRHASRTGDLAAYINPQRFALLLPDTAAEGALTIAQRLHASIDMHNMGQPRHPFSISLALLRYQRCHHTDPSLLLTQAEQILQQAQREGGNRIEVFDAIVQGWEPPERNQQLI